MFLPGKEPGKAPYLRVVVADFVADWQVRRYGPATNRRKIQGFCDRVVSSQAGRRGFESHRPLLTQDLRRTRDKRTFRRSEVRQRGSEKQYVYCFGEPRSRTLCRAPTVPRLPPAQGP